MKGRQSDPLAGFPPHRVRGSVPGTPRRSRVSPVSSQPHSPTSRHRRRRWRPRGEPFRRLPSRFMDHARAHHADLSGAALEIPFRRCPLRCLVVSPCRGRSVAVSSHEFLGRGTGKSASGVRGDSGPMSPGRPGDPEESRSPGWEGELSSPAGLCARCHDLHLVRSRRGLFVRCRRGDRDERFPRYPRLPVVACPGFDPVDSARQPAPPAG